MTREDARTKGARYAAEGRLTVRRVSALGIKADCRGHGEVYRLGWNPREGWHCDCQARATCAHLHALALVVAVRRLENDDVPF